MKKYYFHEFSNTIINKSEMIILIVLNKGRVHNVSVSCHLDLFDKRIIPMLTKGSEIWRYENIDILEKVHVNICKMLLNLKTSTPINKSEMIILIAFRQLISTRMTKFST
jgi:hypothetical protein